MRPADLAEKYRKRHKAVREAVVSVWGKGYPDENRTTNLTSNYVYNIAKMAKSDYLYNITLFYILEVITWPSMNVTFKGILMNY